MADEQIPLIVVAHRDIENIALIVVRAVVFCFKQIARPSIMTTTPERFTHTTGIFTSYEYTHDVQPAGVAFLDWLRS